jgi:hypothetical protein
LRAKSKQFFYYLIGRFKKKKVEAFCGKIKKPAAGAGF